MIVGQFCETYPPSLDGVGRVMLGYCQALEKRGCRALYIAPSAPGCTEEAGCETLLYGGVGIPGEPYRIGVPGWSASYRRQAKAVPFDLVHAHSPFLAGRSARRIARRRHIPLVATFHSKYYDDFYKFTHSRALSRMALRYVLAFYRSCDEVWAVNQRTAEVLRGYGYQGEIVVMPNGTDPQFLSDDAYRAAIRRFSIREGVPVLLFMGQQDFKKNLKSVLEACAVLTARNEDYQLLMVGVGQDLPRLQDMANKLGIAERVLFTGFVADRDTALALHRRADLFVFPSLYDNAPMVVREAAAMGTPSLLVEGTCSAEGVMDGENGYLCQNTPESIADAILRALPTVREVGERARQTIPIPWQTIMEQVMARYQALIAAKTKGAAH